jgi:tetratricopeptide (TPR) repeat protein
VERLPRYAAMALAALLLLGFPSPASAVGPWVSPLEMDPGYRDAERLIAAGEWRQALVLLERLLVQYVDAPEVLNYLGFVHRKLKDYPRSKQFYDAALAVKSDYLPALEYQGEWYLETGDVASAFANLRKLESLCGRCHEWQDLAAALERAGNSVPR